MNAINPVTWWHDLEGGPIAEQRPPPPNADAPYRALGDAPTDVPAGDAAKRSQIANALVADRANAQYAATLEPLIAPPPTNKPAPPPPAPAASADASSASLAAASAPPPPPARSVARAAPATPSTAAAVAVPSAADLPPVPEQPPAPPVLAGVPGATAPPPPPPTAKPPAPPPAPLTIGAPISVSFASGSAALPSTALAGLKLISRTHGSGLIAITGYGEAKSATPDAQQAAMPLAMARVRSVAAYLLENGVPSSALRIDGEAQGTGAIARVIR